MFTGIIEEIGRIKTLTPKGGGRRLRIEAKTIFEDLKIDDSVSINGVCLTVALIDGFNFEADVIEETLKKTTFAKLQPNIKVNLERALKLETRLGGHLVLGHIDCVGIISSIQKQSLGNNIWITYNKEYAPLIVKTGSICIDGVSLTIARLEGSRLMVSIIPHTWENTALSLLRNGSGVNLEFDIIGKYILRQSVID